MRVIGFEKRKLVIIASHRKKRVKLHVLAAARNRRTSGALGTGSQESGTV